MNAAEFYHGKKSSNEKHFYKNIIIDLQKKIRICFIVEIPDWNTLFINHFLSFQYVFM